MDVQTLIDLAGGTLPLGKRLGVARTTILDWKRTGFIPANRVAQISSVFDLPLEEVVKLAPPPLSKKLPLPCTDEEAAA